MEPGLLRSTLDDMSEATWLAIENGTAFKELPQLKVYFDVEHHATHEFTPPRVPCSIKVTRNPLHPIKEMCLSSTMIPKSCQSLHERD
jgi:hypothetical protein